MKNLRVVAGAAAFALTSALAVTPAIAAETTTAAGGVEGVVNPAVTVSVATCADPHTTVTVTNPDDIQAQLDNYRFVLMKDGVPQRSLRKNLRKTLLNGTNAAPGKLTEADIAQEYGIPVSALKAGGFYSGKFQVKVYLFDSKRNMKGTHETLTFTNNTHLDKALYLGESAVVTPVDPDTLDCTPAAVEVSAPEKAAGEKIVFTGNGFKAGEDVTFTVHSTPVLAGTVAANDQGVATLEWTIPADFALGLHKVNAVGKVSQKAAEAPFTVVKPKETTPTPTDPKKDDPKKDDPKKDDPKKDDSKKVAPKPGTAKVPTAGKPAPKLAKTGADLSILFAGVGVAAAGALALVARRRG